MIKNIYIRLLQYLIGVDVDGDFGPKSQEAADRLIAKIRELVTDFEGVK